MSDIVIRVENLSKQYKIGARQNRHDSLRDHLTESFRSLFRRRGRRSPQSAERLALSALQPSPDGYIWALKDVSFEVRQGEVVGIIGRNGAGKSTLLKVLSRITMPTSGFADIYGLVGSLLEVGTGFHGELTGRENTYLNGAILGMKKVEIDRKFDEIVDFSGVEKFLDTPVKHYSTGMHVRLAFAVAAHLEPDILIVDEVLAVGDARFQKKCLNKMQDVGQQGRTVVFVSHNMQAITRLCKRTVVLDEGKVIADGPSAKTVSAYLNSGLGTTAAREWPDPAKAPAGEVARLRAVRVKTVDGRITDAMDIRQPIGVEMEYEVLKPGYVLGLYYDFFNEEGLCIFSTNDVDPSWRQRPRPKGRWVSRVLIPGNLLAEGTHFVAAGVLALNPTVLQFEERDAVAFQVIDSLDGDSARGDWAGKVDGVVRPLLPWTTQFNSDSSTVDVTGDSLGLGSADNHESCEQAAGTRKAASEP